MPKNNFFIFLVYFSTFLLLIPSAFALLDFNQTVYDGINLNVSEYSNSTSTTAVLPIVQFISTGGTNLYITAYNQNATGTISLDYIHRYTMNETFNIQNAVYHSSFFINDTDQDILSLDRADANIDAINGLTFSSDGTRMFISFCCNEVADPYKSVYSYTLSSAWDITTATYDGINYNMDTGHTGGTVSVIGFGNNGLKLFSASYDGVPDTYNIREHVLTQNYNISTASFSQEQNLFTTGTFSEKFQPVFNKDGDELYWQSKDLGTSTQIRGAELTTPWDISTLITGSNTLDIADLGQCGTATTNQPMSMFASEEQGKFWFTCFNTYIMYQLQVNTQNVTTTASAVGGSYGSFVDSVEGIFPEEDDLTLTQKTVYVLLTIIIVTLAFLLIGGELEGKVSHLMLWITAIVNFLLIVFFTGIGYISIGVILVPIAILMIFVGYRIWGSGG